MTALMGARGYFFFVDREVDDSHCDGIYMYTRWGGTHLPELVQTGMKRGEARWGDSRYFGRTLLRTDRRRRAQRTGYGLSTVIGDDEHAIVRINDLERTVSFCTPGTLLQRGEAPIRSWTYKEFAADPPPLESGASGRAEVAARGTDAGTRVGTSRFGAVTVGVPPPGTHR